MKRNIIFALHKSFSGEKEIINKLKSEFENSLQLKLLSECLVLIITSAITIVITSQIKITSANDKLIVIFAFVFA